LQQINSLWIRLGVLVNIDLDIRALNGDAKQAIHYWKKTHCIR